MATVLPPAGGAGSSQLYGGNWVMLKTENNLTGHILGD
jgi:hypothetical protein